MFKQSFVTDFLIVKILQTKDLLYTTEELSSEFFILFSWSNKSSNFALVVMNEYEKEFEE